MYSTNLFLTRQSSKPDIGYTTGSCAAAAAGAAAGMLVSGKDITYVFQDTPDGSRLLLEILDIRRTENTVSCAVQKDSGTDPDITNGMLVYASVTLTAGGTVKIDGGEGVGRVTLPGLDQQVGNAAINRVPRRMIRQAVTTALAGTGYGADVVISIPGGAEVAEKTFNPRLGIQGGLSVLGTTGIVHPMSDQAVKDTIRVEMHQRRALAYPVLPLVPGSYGREFFSSTYGVSLDMAVTTSNFIADSIEMAAEEGWSRLLFIGHIGKLVKVAAGIRNTHSSYGDHRMEILGRQVRKVCSTIRNADETAALERAVYACISTDQAVQTLRQAGVLEPVMESLTSDIQAHMTAWARRHGNAAVEVIVFSNVHGVLGMSSNACEYMEALRQLDL